jgi:probable phosphoglycerate mutase
MSVKIHLVRHGESIWNREKRLTGWTDVGLTEKGREQARSLRELLVDYEYTAVWSSDLQRAWQTATLAGFDAHQRTHEIREFDFGEYEGRRWDKLPKELVSQFQQFENFQAPKGETGSGFYSRIDAFFDRLDAGHHLVFAHGGVVRSVLRHTSEERFVPNAGITRVDWSNREFLQHIDNPYSDDS